MRKIINSLFTLIVISISFTSCEDLSDRIVLNANVEASTELIIQENTPIVLLEANQTEIALNTSWAEPDFGFDAAPTYKLLLATGDFSSAVTLDIGDNLEKTFTTVELNSIALGLGAEADTASDLSLKPQGFVGGQLLIDSSSKTINVTPYSSILDLTTRWGVVGSAANDWGATPDLPFFTTSTAGVLVAYVNLIDGEIKFREDSLWTNNYGDTGADGTLDAGGDNISVTAGPYKILMNLNDLTYTMESFSIGIVGSAYNDWGATPDALFTRDWSQPNDNIWVLNKVTLLDGEYKFRSNEAWALNYGDTGADGTLDDGGDNIISTAGTYSFVLDFTDPDIPTYTIN